MRISDDRLTARQRDALWKWRWLGWRDSTPAFKASLTLLFVAAVAIAVFAAVPGCTGAAPDEGATPPAESPSAGLRLAPGFYDLEDGTAQALGTLEHRDLEGGFWVLIGGFEGEAGTVVAVIANGDEFADTLRPLEGRTVLVTGKRFEGTSVRMAGPEIEASSIKEMTDTPGIVE